ncbi:hypothetical protein KFZ58_15560 [Virgibacillus sp. NKC19-16]|uniref:sigma factor n=1 Tax=Virgibacillus salidurans TaxID=2831673 RepID=UPI001F45224A|nr:sigma factor [Virgibacillus sp. NKC19-16]UJL45785.1 hypothetical protein KFZ58_15560 [Virgibacillus sp. NKC19-16]
MANEKMTFDEIYAQNERRMYYQIYKMNISNPQQEFYPHGLVAMWKAYEKYQPDKGPLATYFTYTIQSRIINQCFKQTREKEKQEIYLQEKEMNDSNYQQNDTAIYSTIKPEDPIFLIKHFERAFNKRSRRPREMGGLSRYSTVTKLFSYCISASLKDLVTIKFSKKCL